MKSLTLATAFENAGVAAARGDWRRARQAYGKYLKAAPRDWRGLYQAGLLEARGGHFDLALKAFERARGLAGDDPRILVNLAQVYLLTDCPAEAAPLLEVVAAAVPGAADVHRQLGIAYQGLARLSESEAAFRKALDPKRPDPAVLNNLAVVLQALGRFIEAIEMLETARRLDGGVEILNNLANLYKTIGRMDKAEEIFLSALRRDPLNLHPHRNLALLFRDRGDAGKTWNAARRAAIVAPERTDGLVIAAEILEHRADLDAARRLAGLAMVGDPDNADAVVLVARTHRRAEDPETARAILAQAKSGFGARTGLYKLHFEAAQAEQALGNHDRAFRRLLEANRSQLDSMAPGKVDPARAFERVRAIRAALEALQDAPPGAGPPIDQDAPVFMVGFPRSGTTLLDQILDSHPRVQVLEERPLVTGMIGRIGALGRAYPRDLAALDEDALEILRTGYFEDRDRYTTVRPSAVFVDKMPLNITDAALIQQVFPGARFILSVRDPCDVCLSCFMQAFDLNDWMAVFTDLEATARLYAEVFDLWFRAVEKLDLDHHVVRYEDLTRDLPTTAAAAIGFLGLDWDDRMADFHEHARRRGHLSTPSHAQVTQPVYRHAVNRWKRYGAVMDEAARILAPYRQALGYGDETEGGKDVRTFRT